MTRLRVLFVDDEVAVLEGLENLLRKQRKEWDMVFASSAQRALEAIERDGFDVVVSDMRMPGMDGAELLQRVLDERPGTVRIVLSGYAERGAISRSLPVAHQFLSKPCEADALIDVIGRSKRLQTMLQDETLRRVAGGLGTLPSAPKTFVDLTQALAEPNVTTGKLGHIIETDPAMAGKVLQLVNSAYFGLARQISSIEQAVTYLGIDILKGLVLNAHVFQTIDKASKKLLSLDALQAHSLQVARLASKIVRARRDVAFTAGVVHDIGKIVLANGKPEQFAAALRMASEEGCPLYVAERQFLSVTHAEIGAYLLGIWGLPFDIIEAVAYHHTPAVVTSGPREILAAVHVVDALLDQKPHEIDHQFLLSAGLACELSGWEAIVAEEMAIRSAA